MIEWLSELESQATIISNEAMAVQFLTDSQAIQLTTEYDPERSESREGYEEAIDQVRSDLMLPDSYLVLFGAQHGSSDLARLLSDDLEPVLLSGDGVIFASSVI